MLFVPLLTLASSLFWCWRLRADNLISPLACLLHLAFALTFVLAAYLARRSPRLRRAGWPRWAWRSACVLVLLVFNLAAGGNFISRSAWGDPLSAPQLWAFLQNEPVIWETLRHAFGARALLVAAAAVALLAAAFRLYRRLTASSWLAGGASRLMAGTPLFASAGAAGLAILLLLVLYPAEAREEPLIAFAGGSASVTDLDGLETWRKIAAALDRRVLAEYAPPSSAPRTNVIVILADSLRADHFPAYGYSRPTTPFLSELEADGQGGALLKVDDAFSTCSDSFCGIASVLTGKAFHKISLESLKIYELLASAGYGNQMILAGDHEKFADLGRFYGPVAQRRLPKPIARLNRAGDDRQALAYVDSLPHFAGEPMFFYFFLFSTHVLGQRLPGFDVYQPDDVQAIKALWCNRDLQGELARIGRPPAYVQQMVNHYDNNLMQGDFVLRRIFEGLRDKGYLEDAIVVISGDHGDALGEHNHSGHGFLLYNEDIRVPLLIWDSRPGARLARVGHASHADIAPTLLDRLGLPIPPVFSGSSLYRERTQHISVHMTRRGREPCAAAIRSEGESLVKLIACRFETRIVEELYDLRRDPSEARNLLAEGGESPHRPLLAALRESLHFFYRRGE
jgi:hypothetical protein